ncbi:MAG: hypothetical protein J0H14_05440, partial [Alphaproteobacteria bacterium]|nr:hypothetical protein [Alphaproteobacteria bacterium]
MTGAGRSSTTLLAGKESRVGVDGPAGSSAKMFGRHNANMRAVRMEITRIAIDTSKHVFTLHGV